VPAASATRKQVEKLLGKRGKDGAVEYKVKWQGFAAAEASWEPASALSCDEHIAAFEKAAAAPAKKRAAAAPAKKLAAAKKPAATTARARWDGAGQRTTSDAQLAMPSNALNTAARSPVCLCSSP
jgi:hypothetical protein